MNDSTNPTSVVDPGILEMGASVSVNDELRRNITAETAEIDNVCAKLVLDVTTEEQRAKEMEKSKLHSGKEQFCLTLSTREMSDTSHMNSHIFNGLQSRVEKEITFKSSPLGKRSETASDGKNVVTPTDIKQQSPTSVFAIQQTNDENKETILTLSKKLGQSIFTIRKFKNEINEMLAAKTTIYHKVKSEHLKVVLANAKHKVNLLEDILKDKQMHHHTSKVNCDMIDAQNKSLHDNTVALEIELAEKKKALEELEGIIGKVEAKLDDMKHVMADKGRDLEKDLKLYDEKVARLSTSFDEASNLIKKREEVKDQFDHLRIDRGTSFTMKMSLQSEITGMNKKLENDRRTIHNEKILAETIAKSFNENLDLDIDSKKAELEDLIIKDKSHTEFLKTKNFPDRDNLLQAAEQEKKKLAKMKDEISCMKLEIEAKGSKLKEHKRLLVDHREEYENVFEKIRGQIVEEKETYTALERQIEEAIANASTDDYGLILRNAKLYKYAAKILQASIAKETKLAEMLSE